MMFEHDAWFVVCKSEAAYLAWESESPVWTLPAKAKKAVLIGVFPLKKARELAEGVEWPYGRRHISIERAEICACCGKTRFSATLTLVAPGPPPQWRCERHLGRNPCVVPGCGRTREGRRPSLNAYVCGRHWKAVPRAMRLAYSRIWRLERKSGGWTDLLVRRHNRIWARIVRAAVDGTSGSLDIREIERLFGL